MTSSRKFIVEMDGRAVYSSKSYENVRRVAWRLIHLHRYIEIIVHLDDIIVGI